MSRGAVTYAATVYAYRVEVWGPDAERIADYEGGNSPHDSAAYVDPSEGVSLETMRRFALETAQGMAAAHGIDPDAVGYDSDLESDLLYAYAPKED